MKSLEQLAVTVSPHFTIPNIFRKRIAPILATLRSADPEERKKSLRSGGTERQRAALNGAIFSLSRRAEQAEGFLLLI